MAIPKKFYNVDEPGHPVKAYTVGKLIEALQELPKSLRIRQGFANGCRVVVYNVGSGDHHLAIEDNED